MTVIQDAPSLETLLHNVSNGSKGLKELILKDNTARNALLKSLRDLTAALETPEDVVTRLVYAVGEIAANISNDADILQSHLLTRVRGLL